MKFTLNLTTADGKWVGGFICRREDLKGQLHELRTLATDWRQPVVVTRVDRRRTKEETYTVLPRQ
jgi:hypothetical protein